MVGRCAVGVIHEAIIVGSLATHFDELVWRFIGVKNRSGVHGVEHEVNPGTRVYMVGNYIVQLRGPEVGIPDVTITIGAAQQGLLVDLVPDLGFEVDVQATIELILEVGDVILEQLFKAGLGEHQVTTSSG